MAFTGKYYQSGRKIIKEIMRDKGVSTAELARRTGASRQLTMARLNPNVPHDIPADVLALLLRSLGYTVIVVPMTYKLGDRAFFIKWQSGKNRKGQPFEPDEDGESEGAE